jgi:LacI family transcriptional regulator
MGATIKDVAVKAGVSITTVSHVLNKTRFVSDDLRERVVQAMEALHYRPNVLARSLRVGESHTMGLVVPDNSNPFFAEIARIIENAGFRHGYSVFLCNSDGQVEKERAYVDTFINKQVDGVVFITSGGTTGPLEELTRHDIPVVVVDRNIPLSLVDLVLLDNEAGGHAATRHLIELGHRRIACITGPSALTPSADRVLGYRRAMAEAGLPVPPECIQPGDFRSPSGEAAMRRLLELAEPPSAVFACNDLMAIGALRALRKADRPVPDDISLVGFDDVPLATEVTPALTTVAQPTDEIATSAVNLLLGRINADGQPGQPERRVLKPSLIVRDSTAQPSRWRRQAAVPRNPG